MLSVRVGWFVGGLVDGEVTIAVEIGKLSHLILCISIHLQGRDCLRLS